MSRNQDDQPTEEWDQATFWQPDTDSHSIASAYDEAAEVRHPVTSTGTEEPAPAKRRSVGQGLRAAQARLAPLVGGVRRGVRRSLTWKPRVKVPARVGLMVLALLVVSLVWVAVAGPPKVGSRAGSESNANRANATSEPALPPVVPSSPSPEPEAAPTSTSPPPTSPPLTAPPSRVGRPSATPPPARAPIRTYGTPKAGHVFRLASKVSGKSIGVAGGSTSNGARIVQLGTTGASARWKLVDVGEGFFNIISVHTGKALDNTDGSRTPGSPMQQWEIRGKGNGNQQWRFSSVGNGYYLIVNRTSGHALDLRDGGVADGTLIQQWTAERSNPHQLWRLVGVS